MSNKITLVPLCTVGVVRGGKNVDAVPGVPFEFTADEVEDIEAQGAVRGRQMFRKALNEEAAAKPESPDELTDKEKRAAAVKAESDLAVLVRAATEAADKAATSKATDAQKKAADNAAKAVREHCVATGLPVPEAFDDTI